MIFNFHKILFSSVLIDIERRKWKDFDFHRYNFTSTIEKIKDIKWIVVDKEKYDKIYNKKHNSADTFSTLRSSTYSHYSFGKCFPSPRTCQECYKYFCPCCNSGTNCMYGKRCLYNRCLDTINNCYPNIYEIESSAKRVFVYSSSFDLFAPKKSVCQREIYGY